MEEEEEEEEAVSALPRLLLILRDFSQACCAVPSLSPYLPNTHS